MTIYIVRHGESVSRERRSEKESNSAPLSHFGKLQANATGKVLKRFRVEKIFSSPIIRTRETAEIIARHVGTEIEYDERLREFAPDMNEKDPVTLKSLKIQARENPDQTTPSGESFNMAIGRLESALVDIAKLPITSACVVTHRVVLEGWLSKRFGIRSNDHEWLHAASVTAVRASDGEIQKLLFVNRRFRDLPLLLEIIKRRIKYSIP